MNLFKRWRLRQQTREAMHGYDYAAGALLRSNGQAWKRLDAEKENGEAFDSSPFDKGMGQALADWCIYVRDPRPSICRVHDAQDCHRGCPYRER